VETANLTPKQRRAVEEVIFKERTLDDAAADEGKSAQALWYRIEGTRGHGGIRKKAPVLYALWIFRNRERHDISEVLNAIRRAIDSLDTQSNEQPAEAEARR
jgi:hypothetical protein